MKYFLILLLFVIPIFTGATEIANEEKKSKADLELAELTEFLDKEISPFFNKYQDDDIICKVNDDIVEFKDIKDGFRNMLRHHVHFLKDKPLKETYANKYMHELIGRRAMELLLEQEIKKRNLYPDSLELEKKFQVLKKEIITYKGVDDFASGVITADDAKKIKEVLNKQIALKILYEQFDGNIEDPLAEEVKAFYEQNQEQFKIPRKIRFSVIVINNNDESKETSEKNYKFLERLKDDIISGKRTFEFVAKNFSDSELRKKHGDMGFISVPELKDPFKLMLNLKINEISPIFSSKTGVYIAKLTDDIPASIREFNSVKDKIFSALKKQMMMRNRQTILMDLQKNAKIQEIIKP